ncbi:MAG: pyridoxamine 5'-phosphate oxidase family protein [Chloroflexi bacterium]|nr:pyridoxamine 5'-phosphate oxidase family protein [Chloroflexota bacterium]
MSTWMADRPAIPAIYGIPKTRTDLLSWSFVTERMEAAQHYWISTVSTNARPHAVPVDGIWLDDRLFFGGSPESRWIRDLRSNQASTAHLESATEVLILEGTVTAFDRTWRELAERLAAASKEKYGYGSTAEGILSASPGPTIMLRPTTVIGWKQFPIDATRWRLDVEHSGADVATDT